jgi:hypothetical protein
VGGALGTTDQHAQLAGTLEQRREWRRAFEDDVCGKLHLGHAVAMARLQRRTLGWAEDGDEPTEPVAAASLQERHAQAIEDPRRRGPGSAGWTELAGIVRLGFGYQNAIDIGGQRACCSGTRVRAPHARLG